MSNLPEAATWRELLGQLILNPKERQRLATAIRVRPITLQRWSEGNFKPRDEHLRMLIKNLPPGIYSLFMHLLLVEFPQFFQQDLPEERFSQHIPSGFYERALSNLSMTPQPMYRQSMQDLLLQQALEHLDPDRRGLSIILAACVTPRPGQKVRSLREMNGLATPPWPHDLADKGMFLGMESLAGYAISHARPAIIDGREQMTFFPVRWTEHEQSTAAFPVMLQARFVGCMIVSSTREDFFTPQRLAVIEDYSHLAACIFETEESFAPDEIDLRLMPTDALQLPYFASYHQRLLNKFAEASNNGQQIQIQEARQLVWQDLEDELLQLPQRMETTDPAQI